jgi:tetratricopeptide (TPR) repeat protein
MPELATVRASLPRRPASLAAGLVAAAVGGCAAPGPTRSAHRELVEASAGGARVGVVPPGGADAPPPQAGRLLRPDEIFEILDASPIQYRLVDDETVAGSPLAALVELILPASQPVDPFVEVFHEGPEGQPRIRSARPPDAIAEVFERAGQAFEAQDYELARALWSRAASLAPDYFKTYTFLGNSLHHLGDYVRAEEAFLRALELNPFDYQALLFLGDTYHQLGDYGRAKAVLSRAFMLNRGNEAVVERLKASLAKLSLQIRGPRLAPKIRIAEEGPRQVTLRLDAGEGTRWLSLAACLACWTHEERCSARAPADEDPLRLGMYRECLLNQAASVAVRRERAEPIGRDEAALLGAVEDGYLDALIFWEVIAEVAPPIILLLPEGLQEDILRYIEKYVFASTMVI